MRLVLLSAVCALTLLAPTVANAHPLPKSSGVKLGLHKICSAVGVCKDRPPRLQYGPNTLCDKSRDGDIETIYDPKLGAEVDWQCRCINEVNCTWFRVGIRQSVFSAFWREQPRRYVRDWQRACPSIVCEGRLVRHFYPIYSGHAR